MTSPELEEANQSNLKKRVADELASPIEDDEQLLEKKRAYNRECARRARRRGKELVTKLKIKVMEVQNDRDELLSKLSSMSNHLKLLEAENRKLRALIEIIPNYNPVERFQFAGISQLQLQPLQIMSILEQLQHSSIVNSISMNP